MRSLQPGRVHLPGGVHPHTHEMPTIPAIDQRNGQHARMRGQLQVRGAGQFQDARTHQHKKGHHRAHRIARHAKERLAPQSAVHKGFTRLDADLPEIQFTAQRLQRWFDKIMIPHADAAGSHYRITFIKRLSQCRLGGIQRIIDQRIHPGFRTCLSNEFGQRQPVALMNAALAQSLTRFAQFIPRGQHPDNRPTIHLHPGHTGGPK